MERKIYVYGYEFGFDNHPREFNGYAISSPITDGKGFVRSSKDLSELVASLEEALKNYPDSILESSIPRMPVYQVDSIEIYTDGEPTIVKAPDDSINEFIIGSDLSHIKKVVVHDGSHHYVYSKLAGSEMENIKSSIA